MVRQARIVPGGLGVPQQQQLSHGAS
jgi:hypothetical protein